MSNLKELNSLKAELKKLEQERPHLYASSVEDVDDAYQARLEWQWEVEDLRERVKEMERAI